MSAVTSNRVRRVIIDDDDRKIIYRGPWKVNTDAEAFDESPYFGYVYGGSQHYLLGDPGSLTFRFSGSGSVVISGTSNPLNMSGTYDPSHSCELDGITVPPQEPLQNLAVNIWPLCFTNATDAGDHVLTLSADSTSRAFYVDQIIYVPDYNSPPVSPTVAIDPNDVAVEYVEGSWDPDGVGGMLTQEAGAKMTITFTGSSARFIGNVPREYPGDNSTATYSIDGAPPVTFNVPGLGRNDLLPLFNQPFFWIKDLGSGIHDLVITHNGPAAPLVFNSLEVEDGDAIQSALTPEARGDNPPGGGGSGKKKPLGAIIGGAVGGAVFILALIALLLVLRKRKKKQRAQAAAAAAATITPLDSPTSHLSPTYEVKPLRYSDQSPPSTFQTMSNTGTDSLQHGPMPAFYGHQANHSTSSYTGGQPFNPSAQHSPSNGFGPLAPVPMSVSYAQPGQQYSRAPEPMA